MTLRKSIEVSGMTGWEFAGGFVALIVALIAFQVMRNRRGREVFRSLADGLGGEFVPGYAWEAGVVNVSYRGAKLTLDTHSTPGGDHTTYTRLSAQFESDQPVSFLLLPRNLGSRMLVAGVTKIPFPLTGRAKAALEPLRETRHNEIPTGDAAFDGEFMLSGISSEFLIRFLTEPETVILLSKIHIHDVECHQAGRSSELIVVVHGEVYDRDRLLAMVDFVKRFVDHILFGA